MHPVGAIPRVLCICISCDSPLSKCELDAEAINITVFSGLMNQASAFGEINESDVLNDTPCRTVPPALRQLTHAIYIWGDPLSRRNNSVTPF